MTDINARFIKVRNVQLERLNYGDGSTAVVVTGKGEEQGITISVNLAAYGMTAPDGCIYVPEYSQYEGLPEALIDAKIADPIKRVQFGPHDASAWLMRLVHPTLTDAHKEN